MAAPTDTPSHDGRPYSPRARAIRHLSIAGDWVRQSACAAAGEPPRTGGPSGDADTGCREAGSGALGGALPVPERRVGRDLATALPSAVPTEVPVPAPRK